MSFGVAAGIVLVFALIVGVGMLSGRKVKSSEDFLSGGGKTGAFLVSGTILGSLVGSQATIGTAQLAFNYGLSAWWFTLGSGVGCLALGLGYVRKLRSSGCSTEVQIISREYGASSGPLASVLGSAGIFISILSQTVACTSLLTVLFPGASLPLAALVSVGMMCVYVVFGGAWGAGMGGAVKLLLLCFTSVLGFLLVLVSSGGFTGLYGKLSALFLGTGVGQVQGAASSLSSIATLEDFSNRYLSLTARGVGKDVGSGISLLLGVLSTQTYAQAVWSAKSDSAARKGALLCALVIPLIGVGGILVGLFMRSHYLLAAEVTALQAAGLAVPDMPVLESTIQAFPQFVLNHMPPLLSGTILGTLFITVVGGGAGLSLGMATILVKDIIKKLSKNGLKVPGRELLTVRVVIGVILLGSAVITVAVPNTTVNDLGFLSMGLRGSVIFLPMTAALWLPGRVDRRCVVLSMILSPCGVLLGKLLQLSVDPLFVGMAVSAALCSMGFFIAKRKKEKLIHE